MKPFPAPADWQRVLLNGLVGFTGPERLTIEGEADVKEAMPGRVGTVYLVHRTQFVDRLKEAYPWIVGTSQDLERQAKVLIDRWVSGAGFIPLPTEPQHAYIRWLMYRDVKVEAGIAKGLMDSLLDVGRRNRRILTDERQYLLAFSERTFTTATVEFSTGEDLAARRARDESRRKTLISKMFSYKTTQLDHRTDKPALRLDPTINQDVPYFQDEEDRRDDLNLKLDGKKRARDEEARELKIRDVFDTAGRAFGRELEHRLSGKLRRLSEQVDKIEDDISASFAREKSRISDWNRFMALRESIRNDPYLKNQLGDSGLWKTTNLLEHLHGFDYPTKIFPDERAEIEKDKRRTVFPAYAGEWNGFGTRAVYMK